MKNCSRLISISRCLLLFFTLFFINRTEGQKLVDVLTNYITENLAPYNTTTNSFSPVNYALLDTTALPGGYKLFDTAGADDVVTIDGQKVFLNGTVRFSAGSGQTLTIDVGKDNTVTAPYVSIQPLAAKIVKYGTNLFPAITSYPVSGQFNIAQTTDEITMTRQYAQIIFEPEEGGVINVNLYKDLILTGSNYSAEYPRVIHKMTGALHGSSDQITLSNSDLATELYVIFRGKGTTVFNIADGKRLVIEANRFTALTTPTHTIQGMIYNSTEGDAINAGCHFIVAQDDTKANVVGAGINKIVFQRMDYNSSLMNSRVRIGADSFFSFVSTAYRGTDGSGAGEGESYAAVAFDVSGAGSGRLELQITGPVDSNGSPIVESGRDGAFVLGGNFLGTVKFSGSTPIVTPGAYTNLYDYLGVNPSGASVTPTTGIDFSQPAGSQAILRIIDNLAYESDSNYRASLADPERAYRFGSSTTNSTVSGGPYRRGLVVSNNNLSQNAFASNPYLDGGWFDLNAPTVDGSGVVWNNSMPHRFGFIVGINGQIEVNHNCFLEYEALAPNLSIDPTKISKVNSSNQSTLTTALSSANLTADNVFKKHNPSALVVDGVDVLENALTGQTKIQYLAASKISAVNRHPVFLLRGDASINLRSAVLGQRIDGTGYDAGQSYNGRRVPFNDAVSSSGDITSYGESPGEGIHVMDVEGNLQILSIDDFATTSANNTDAYGYHTGSGFTVFPTGGALGSPLKGGSIRLPTLLRDYADRELQLITTPNVFNTRPLTIGKLYHRYDKPAIFANGTIDIRNIRWICDDVSRDIGSDTNTSDPVILGGERAVFLSKVYNLDTPDISFLRPVNTEFHLFESMCLSGVRILVRELFDELKLSTSDPVHNVCSVNFYNHGHNLDSVVKGFGRALLLGSKLSKTQGGDSNPFLESSYLSVFRHTGLPETSTSTAFVNNNVTLSLKTYPQHPTGVDQTQRSMHMFMLGNQSWFELGWTTTEGILQSKEASDPTSVRVYPFDHLALTAPPQSQKFNITASSTNDNGTTSLGELPATLSIDGDNIYFGAKDYNGNGSPQTVDSFGLGRVIYVGHGGKLAISSDTSVSPARPYVCNSDATIAVRVWLDTDVQRGLNPILNLPSDQMLLANPIHPYDMDMAVLGAGTGATAYLSFKALTGRGFGTVARIAWDKVRGAAVLPSLRVPFEFAESVEFDFKEMSRSINIRTTPVPMPPSGLIRMQVGDYVDQLSVTGATAASPFLLYMSGGSTGFPQVREITWRNSDHLIPGEGPYAYIFLDGNARLGLGTRNWNADSVNAFSRLGVTQTALLPNGSATVDLNSDVIIYDETPFIPTQNFGSADSSGNLPEHRLTFYSQDANEIRIPAGKSLNLAAFGKHTASTVGATNGKYGLQEIAFGGKTRLVFEPGSELRFPDFSTMPTDTNKMPVLYMTDDSEIIFEELPGPSGFSGATTLAETNRAKIRILGHGQIWLNKRAKMTINNGAIVAVEADAKSPRTNIILSVQREGAVSIGDDITAGGALQIGNPSTIAGVEYIDFYLALRNADSRFQIGRNGFFGIGAGVVDASGSRINSWKVASLKGLRNVMINQGLDLTDSSEATQFSGIFSHNRIYDGNSRESSLMALGPVSLFNWAISDSSVIRGGGNLISLPDSNSVVSVNVLNSASSSLTAPSIGMFASGQQFRTNMLKTNWTAGSSVIGLQRSGGAYSTVLFTGDQTNAFTFISQPDIQSILKGGSVFDLPRTFVPFSSVQGQYRYGYVSGSTINRVPLVRGKILDSQNTSVAADSGALVVKSVDSVSGQILYLASTVI